MKSASFRLAFGFALAIWAHPGETADMRVVPTPEQDEHCRLVADGKCPLVYSVRGLTFPEKADELGFFTRTARMGIFKPKGDGPFPAVLILHACGAVDADPEHMHGWVKQAVGRGYVAFVVDSWGQRGITELCTSGPRNFPPFLSIHLDVRVRDAYEALNHLAKFDFVDRNRVGVVGFSNGGRTAYLTVSAQMAKKYAHGGARFAAAVGVYGKCSFMQSDAPLARIVGRTGRRRRPKGLHPAPPTNEGPGGAYGLARLSQNRPCLGPAQDAPTQEGLLSGSTERRLVRLRRHPRRRHLQSDIFFFKQSFSALSLGPRIGPEMPPGEPAPLRLHPACQCV